MAKPGSSQAAAAKRRGLFVDAYLANGGNATDAAKTAGYSPKTAYSLGARLLKHVEVRAAIEARSRAVAEKAGLSVERTLREVARLAYADPRKLFNEDGSLKPIHELDDDTAATVASLEIEEEFGDAGEEQEGQPHGGSLKRNRGRDVVGFTKKLKTWDKNAALEKAMKYHGLYEKDNSQSKPTVIIQGPAARVL